MCEYAQACVSLREKEVGEEEEVEVETSKEIRVQQSKC
jgi:hypothetical protein